MCGKIRQWLFKPIYDYTDALEENITDQLGDIMADLSALTSEVQQNSDAVDSAVVLLSSLATQVRDLSTDPAALQALADSLDADSTALAEAVVANTPVWSEPDPDPAPPVEPVPEPPVDA